MTVIPDSTKEPSRAGTPWLSVIVPIYNAERYLEKCVRSILAQSFGDFEVLLMDDGSGDRSPDLCRAFAAEDPRIKYIPKENTGCYHNRLCGFYRAKGAYVTTIDADDYYLSNDVFRILHQKTQERECDLLQFGMQRVYRHLRRNGRVNDADSTVLAEEFHKKDQFFAGYVLDSVAQTYSNSEKAKEAETLYRSLSAFDVKSNKPLDGMMY